MIRTKTFRLILSMSFALMFLYLLFRKISFNEIKHAFSNAHFGWIAGALSAFVIDYFCKIERWRIMLQHDNPSLKWRTCAGPLLAGFATSNILPFRAGELVRSFAFNRRLGTTSGVVIATLFVERLLDLLMVLILLGAALTLFDIKTYHFAGISGMALIVASAATLVILIFPSCCAKLALALGNLIIYIKPKLGQKILNEINKGLIILQQLAKSNAMIKLIIWSLIAWLAEGCIFWLAALALPSITTPLAAWLALPVGTLATLIPSTPGNIGTFDYFTARAMTDLGNIAAAATAYTFLVHALLWLPSTVFGSLYLFWHSTHKQHKSNGAI